jgi:prevent-host-death family protein
MAVFVALSSLYSGHVHGHLAGEPMSRTLSAAEFKATCLQVLDQVAARNETVVVTKKGRPVAHVVPIVRRRSGFGVP